MIAIFDEFFDGFLHEVPNRPPDREAKTEEGNLILIEKVWDIPGGVIRTIERKTAETELDELNRLLKEAVSEEDYVSAAVYKKLIDEQTIHTDRT